MFRRNGLGGKFGNASRSRKVAVAVGAVLLALGILSPIALAQPKEQESDSLNLSFAPTGNIFKRAKTISKGVYTQGVGIGDFNHDGLNDVAAGAPGEADELHVFLQDQNGKLGAAVKYPTNIETWALVTGDLNHDNLDDIAISGFGEGKVGVFLQQLDGTFADEVDYPTLETPDSLAIGDLNHDGLNDLAVSHASVPMVGVLYQQENGTLGEIKTKPIEYRSDGDLKIGDVNGDGLLDLVRLNRGRAGNLYIFLQTAGGALADSVTQPIVSNNGAGGLALGDVNGDKLTDIVTGSHLNGRIFVILQQAGGVLAAPLEYLGLDSVVSADLADANKDGRPDLILQTMFNTLDVHLQKKKAIFLPVETYKTGEGWGPHGMAVGDINNDGWADVITSKNGLYVHYNYGPGGTPTPTPTPTKTPKPKPPTVTIMQENFESSFPGGNWHVLDGWGRSRCQATSGVYSAWAVSDPLRDKCSTNYPNSSNNWMIYGPFSLADAKKATLKYNLWLNAEMQKDVFFMGASTDGLNFYGQGYTGPSGASQKAPGRAERGSTKLNELKFETSPHATNEAAAPSWVRMTFNLKQVPTLGNLMGEKKVWLAFVWQTDGQNGLKGGAYVDDVLLTKVKK